MGVLSGHVQFLLGLPGEENSEELFPDGRVVSTGSSRSVRGYLAALRLMDHLLTSVKGRQSFLSANVNRSSGARAYFKAMQKEDGQIKASLTLRARKVLRDRLTLIEDTLRDTWSDSPYRDNGIATPSDNLRLMSLDAQIELSQSLIDDLPNIKQWSPQTMNHFFSLKYCYDRRENEDSRAVTHASVTNGEHVYSYSANGNGLFSGSPDDGGDVEMTSVSNGAPRRVPGGGESGRSSCFDW